MGDNDRKAWVKGARGATAIGAFVARMLDPIARARGFATTALLTEWPAVVGAELAQFTSPDKVIWPRRNDDREAQGQDQRLANRRRNPGAEGRRPPRHRGPAPGRADPGAGQPLFRLSGHRPAPVPASAAQSRGPAPARPRALSQFPVPTCRAPRPSTIRASRTPCGASPRASKRTSRGVDRRFRFGRSCHKQQAQGNRGRGSAYQRTR